MFDLLIGQKVSINWRLTDKQKGIFGFDVLPNTGIVREVKMVRIERIF